MNWLAIMPDECASAERAVLRGARARCSVAAHELKAGIEIAALMWGGRRGRAYVESVSEDEVVLRFSLTETAAAPPPTELIVAVPRPQTVKKILHAAAMLGASRLHFIRSQRIVKSYLSSKGLQPEHIRAELIKGMEQSGIPYAPEVQVHALFKPFVEECLTEALAGGGAKGAVCVLAMPRAPLTMAALASAKIEPDTPVFIAVGPELGWNEHEIECFAKRGFRAVNLGAGILRVETAVTCLLAQAALLRELKKL